MSTTALLWVVLYCAAIIFSLVNPLFGALGYLLEYYMRPELKWWGDALPVLRYNLIISIALGATFLLRRSSLRDMAKVRNPALLWLLTLAAIMIGVTASIAISEPLSQEWSTQWIKTAIIFPLLLVGVIRTRTGFDTFVAAHMLGAFWWGYEAWDDPKREAGRLVGIGSGDSYDDNGASAHLLTVLPFSVIYLLTEKNPRFRAVALLATPFVINTIILCNSRGSLLGILTAVAAAVFLVRSGYRLRMVTAGIAVLVGVFLMADEQFITRQSTTVNYAEDNSAQERLETWKGVYELVKDRPLGAGGRGFHLLSPIYIPDIVEGHGGDLRAPHNTYAMVAAEWGLAGFICYIGIFTSAFIMTRRVKRQAKADGVAFYYWRALAIQLALIAYMVAGAFTDRLYAEAGYWMVALSFALYRVQCTDRAKDQQQSPAPVVERTIGAPADHAATVA
jgi:putative inorganic carbon (HCO3(-)) transporter